MTNSAGKTKPAGAADIGRIAGAAGIGRRAGAAGIAATLWFWSALIVFGALRDDYSQTTKAVSELGVLGAPHALLWNVFGFGLTGLLLTIFFWGAGRALRPGARILPAILALSGLSFLATAAPADFADLGALTSQVHIYASFAAALFWMAGLVLLIFTPGGNGWGQRLIALVFLLAMIGAMALNDSELSRAVVQRLTFAVYFGWVLLTGVLLLRQPKAP